MCLSKNLMHGYISSLLRTKRYNVLSCSLVSMLDCLAERGGRKLNSCPKSQSI